MRALWIVGVLGCTEAGSELEPPPPPAEFDFEIAAAWTQSYEGETQPRPFLTIDGAPTERLQSGCESCSAVPGHAPELRVCD